jgi:mono/diheme cytochrome c family protein
MIKIPFFIFFILFIQLLISCTDSNSANLHPKNEVLLSGSVLFKAKGCYTCHSIGGGDRVGPDLKGLFERRDEPWVRKYLHDPVTMTAEDPIAMELKEKYRAQMPRLNLSSQEIEQLMKFLQTNSQP